MASSLPWVGVTRAEIRAAVEYEAAAGRGPDSPARRQQAMDEGRELARLDEVEREKQQQRKGRR